MGTSRSSPRRRQFLAASAAGAALLLTSSSRASEDEKKSDDEDWVSPPEDLMREHGVLDRLLLIYEATGSIFSAGAKPPADALKSATGLIRRFIEDYHERLEEKHVFPRFEKAGKHVDLVLVLREQHQQGRRLTDEIARLGGANSEAERNGILSAIGAFVRMYRPHAAREDTVLFPGLRDVVGEKEFHELGEQFEDKEHELFGAAGFAGIVEEVAAIERKLGIEDLRQFTPR